MTLWCMHHALELSKSYVDNITLIKMNTFYVYMERLEHSFNNFILYKIYK